MAKKELLLQVKDLVTNFYTKDGVVKAVDKVTFDIARGESVGLVGESGAGKSVTALSVLRLIPSPGEIEGGEVIFDGTDLLELDMSEMRKIRGAKISMVFQDPMTSLNPVLTIGEQIAESIRLHQIELEEEEVVEKVIEYLRVVGIPRPDNSVKQYPHQFSGGMRQRVGIAMALSCNPSLLIADEPTTALDVTIQAQILDLVKDLMKQMGTSLLLITHNLGLVVELTKKVAVMYAGRIVEYSDTYTMFKNPKHPYTIGLHESIPKLEGERQRLVPIPGLMPNLIDLPSGCTFAPRCRHAMPICREKYPDTLEIEPEHLVRCHLYN